MNFFEAQQRARSRTKWLVLWFILGVAATVGSLFFAATFATAMADDGHMHYENNPIPVGVAIGGAVIILLGSLFKLIQLGNGGAVVARDMGARPVDPSTHDLDERRLLNVVQEMAIASGVPVPQVWVMDDENVINAFAAGTEPGNAVIAVTQGCLKNLNRSELQGVIAHEFSHILNGDMRLNMRLIGWLFGLMMIAIIGRGLLSVLRHTRVRSSEDSKNGGAILLAMILAGVLFWLIGSVGVLFARIIQAAVSRQREFLADASAVQFTRDPEGISGALKKIAQQSDQTLLAPKASEASHMFFAGQDGFMNQLLATHPSLTKRIKAIDPSWDGRLTTRDHVIADEQRPVATSNRNWSQAGLSHLGDLSSIDVAFGAQMLNSMGSDHMSLTVPQARGMLFGMLVSQDAQLRIEEMLWLESTLQGEEIAAVQHWSERCKEMISVEKIAMIDLSIPILRKMNYAEFFHFRDMARRLIASDGQISLFELMMERAIERHLAATFEKRDVCPIRYHRLTDIESDLSQLVVCLCPLASSEIDENIAFTQASAAYEKQTGRPLVYTEADYGQLDQVFKNLDAASPTLKRDILVICGIAVVTDGVIADAEIELLRAAADAMGTMLPPLQGIDRGAA